MNKFHALLIATAFGLPLGLPAVSHADSAEQALVIVKISQMKAQLAAVERETMRRLDCQTKSLGTKVSTGEGCIEVPGLREEVGSKVGCALPWGGALAIGQSTTAYLAGSVDPTSSCQAQTRTCQSGHLLSGTYQHQTCTVMAYVAPTPIVDPAAPVTPEPDPAPASSDPGCDLTQGCQIVTPGD